MAPTQRPDTLRSSKATGSSTALAPRHGAPQLLKEVVGRAAGRGVVLQREALQRAQQQVEVEGAQRGEQGGAAGPAVAAPRAASAGEGIEGRGRVRGSVDRAHLVPQQGQDDGLDPGARQLAQQLALLPGQVRHAPRVAGVAEGAGAPVGALPGGEVQARPRAQHGVTDAARAVAGREVLPRLANKRRLLKRWAPRLRAQRHLARRASAAGQMEVRCQARRCNTCSTMGEETQLQNGLSWSAC
mmetsp:Transcript_45614/g.128418  ORF Transcript_45614/g.128418 Transcript_45614/m.128418 type:complete len:243 (+) Transcript_45614:307-1035(+)